MPSVVRSGALEPQPQNVLLHLLARGLRSNDDEIWEEIYARLFPLFYSQLVRIVKDRARAEDLAQEAFLEIWTRRRTINVESGNVLGLLFTMVRNLGKDEWRLRRNRQWKECVDGFGPASGDEEGEGKALLCTNADANAQSPEEGLLSRELAQRVRHALDGLSETDQVILALEFFYEFSQQEIATQLQISPGAMKTRKYRALKRLKAAIEGGPSL